MHRRLRYATTVRTLCPSAVAKPRRALRVPTCEFYRRSRRHPANSAVANFRILAGMRTVVYLGTIERKNFRKILRRGTFYKRKMYVLITSRAIVAQITMQLLIILKIMNTNRKILMPCEK